MTEITKGGRQMDRHLPNHNTGVTVRSSSFVLLSTSLCPHYNIDIQLSISPCSLLHRQDICMHAEMIYCMLDINLGCKG